MLVVTKFFPVSALTDLTKVSVVTFAYPVTALAVPSAPTAAPLAVAFIFVVDGVTVIVGALAEKVVPSPSATSLLPPVNVTVELAVVKVVPSPSTTSVCFVRLTPVTTSVKFNWVSPIFSQLFVALPTTTYSS